MHASKTTPATQGTVTWKKSSYSAGSGNCVEVAVAQGSVLTRDSKAPHHQPVRTNRGAMDSFISAIKSGSHGRPPLITNDMSHQAL